MDTPTSVTATTPNRSSSVNSLYLTPPMTNSPTNAPPLTPALHAQTPGSIDKQIEVLIVCYPQNDFLHPKGAINLSLDSKAKEKRMAQCSHVISKIKRLKTQQMFDHIVVVNRRHYGNNLSFASCMVGSSYNELVHYNCNQSVSTTIMPENCVFGRWGSEIHQELNLQTRTKDHHVIVGLQPLIGEPSPFASFVSESSKEDKQRLHMRHGTVKSKRIVRGTRIASFHENLSSLGSNTSNKRGSHIPLGCQNNQLKSNDLKSLLEHIGTTRVSICGVGSDRSFITTCLEAKLKLLSIPFVIVVDACIGLSTNAIIKAKRSKQLIFANVNDVITALKENTSKLQVRAKQNALRPLPPKDENDVELNLPMRVAGNPVTIMRLIRFRQAQRVAPGTKVLMPSRDLLQRVCPLGLLNIYQVVEHARTSPLHAVCSSNDHLLLTLLFKLQFVSAAENNKTNKTKGEGKRASGRRGSVAFWSEDADTTTLYHGGYDVRQGVLRMAPMNLISLSELNFIGQTPLMVALEPPTSTNCIHLLMKYAMANDMISPLMDTNLEGRSGLMCACAYGEAEVVALLIKQTKQMHDHSDLVELIMATDDSGYNAMHYVCAGAHSTQGRLMIVRELLGSVYTYEQRLKLISNLCDRGWSPLHLMSKNSMLSSLPWELLPLRKIPFHVLTQEGVSLLHLGAWNGNMIVVRMLCSHKTKIETKDNLLVFDADENSKTSKTVPWVEKMPKNILMPMTQWSELDACLLRGYTHTAVWLCRNGYHTTNRLPQKDLDYFLKRTIQHGDLVTFLALLKSPRKISLSTKLIQLITTLESFPRSSGSGYQHRHWVPSPIDVSLRMLKTTTNLDFYTHVPTDIIELIASSSHNLWIDSSQREQLEMHHNSLKKEKNFCDLNEPEKRKLLRTVATTIMTIQSLGFELTGLDNSNSSSNSSSAVFSTELNANAATAAHRLSYRNSIFDEQDEEEAEKVYQDHLHTQSLTNFLLKENEETTKEKGDTPTPQQMLRLKQTLAINLHEVWSLRKKQKGFVYGKDMFVEEEENDDHHQDHLRNENRHQANKYDERLVPFDNLMIVYRLRCQSHAKETIRILLSLGICFRLKDQGDRLDHAFERLRARETNQFDSAETQLLQEHSIDGSSLSTANNSDSSNSNINLIRQLMLNQLLRRAVRENNCTATNKLLTPGENNVTASLDTIDDTSSKRTIVHYCILHGHLDVLKILYNFGANIGQKDKSGITPLHMASHLGHVNMVDFLLNTGRVSSIARDTKGWCAIHYASYSNKKACVEHLVKDLIGIGRPGIDFVNGLATDWRETVLNLDRTTRVRKSSRKSVLKHVPLKRRNGKFITPLTLAVQRLSIDAVRVLVFNGADATLLDSTGVCPYDRALLMADELSGRLKALDKQIQGVQHLMLKGSALRTKCCGHVLYSWWFSIRMFCKSHCSGSGLSTLEHHRRKGDHFKMLNTSLFERQSKSFRSSNLAQEEIASATQGARGGKKPPNKKVRRGSIFASKIRSESERELLVATLRKQQNELQKLTRLRDSLVQRYDTVGDVLRAMVKSPFVKTIRTSFAIWFVFKFFIVWVMVFGVVILVSPLALTHDYRSKDVFDTIVVVKQYFQKWNKLDRGLQEWANFHERHLINDQAFASSSSSLCVAKPFDYNLNARSQIMSMVGNMKIDISSFGESETSIPSSCTLPGGLSVSPCYNTRGVSSNVEEYFGQSTASYYLSCAPSGQQQKNNTISTSSNYSAAHQLVPKLNKARKITTTINLYTVQLKVILQVKLIVKQHPTGYSEQSIEIEGGLLPSGLNTSTWTQRHAPSSLFVVIYFGLFLAGCYLRYIDFSRSGQEWNQWVVHPGNLLSLVTTLLTLVIVFYDVAIAQSALNNVVNGILQFTNSQPHAQAEADFFLSGTSIFINAQNTERQLFAIQLLFFWVPLLLSLRMLPHIGPTIVALINAVVNWTVGLYILFLGFILAVVSSALHIAFGNDSSLYNLMHTSFKTLLGMSLAEEFNNISTIGTRPIIIMYSICYLLLILVLLNIFLAIVSNRYLFALEESLQNWQQLITTKMEQNRRSSRNKGWNKNHQKRNTKNCDGRCCGRKKTNPQKRGHFMLWTSAMQNVLIQTRVLGKLATASSARAPKRPPKRFRVLGHQIVFDASFGKQSERSNSIMATERVSSNIRMTIGEESLREQASKMEEMNDESQERVGKMGTHLNELTVLLKLLHRSKRKMGSRKEH